MSTVLVPVDFSPASENALRYAVELSRQRNMRIELLHAYPIPIAAPDMPLEMIITEEILNDVRQQMDALVTSMNLKNNVDTKFVAGSAASEVIYVAQQQRPQLVVMGTHGASASRSRWFGGNTLRVIERASVPVLAVPAHATYKPWQKVVCATDFDYHEISAIQALAEWVKTYNAELVLVHINDGDGKNDAPAYRESFIEKVREVTGLANIQYEYVAANLNLVDALREYAVFHNADVLVMLHRLRSGGLSRLWHRSLTREVAQELPIALLSIPVAPLEVDSAAETKQ